MSKRSRIAWPIYLFLLCLVVNVQALKDLHRLIDDGEINEEGITEELGATLVRNLSRNIATIIASYR
ncbi:MAG: hypothetical protein KME60_13205 [Cyanomargarita calcarea GSE-NOS-MK-12-04C]|jgi:hypothetical protein|uniref:Uncharacterized protein n=1 Tax=Cyanomargarita calcarea GSE-NOS-MK-12-04C TaxID=2839659 RepID=A0A951QNQ4_9CYAN|nr:hypothetical protein [Cyanomargarita calcarea GSE-NOS-MK-12-04C]